MGDLASIYSESVFYERTQVHLSPTMKNRTPQVNKSKPFNKNKDEKMERGISNFKQIFSSPLNSNQIESLNYNTDIPYQSNKLQQELSISPSIQRVDDYISSNHKRDTEFQIFRSSSPINYDETNKESKNTKSELGPFSSLKEKLYHNQDENININFQNQRNQNIDFIKPTNNNYVSDSELNDIEQKIKNINYDESNSNNKSQHNSDLFSSEGYVEVININKGNKEDQSQPQLTSDAYEEVIKISNKETNNQDDTFEAINYDLKDQILNYPNLNELAELWNNNNSISTKKSNELNQLILYAYERNLYRKKDTLLLYFTCWKQLYQTYSRKLNFISLKLANKTKRKYFGIWKQIYINSEPNRLKRKEEEENKARIEKELKELKLLENIFSVEPNTSFNEERGVTEQDKIDTIITGESVIIHDWDESFSKTNDRNNERNTIGDKRINIFNSTEIQHANNNDNIAKQDNDYVGPDYILQSENNAQYNDSSDNSRTIQYCEAMLSSYLSRKNRFLVIKMVILWRRKLKEQFEDAKRTNYFIVNRNLFKWYQYFKQIQYAQHRIQHTRLSILYNKFGKGLENCIKVKRMEPIAKEMVERRIKSSYFDLLKNRFIGIQQCKQKCLLFHKNKELKEVETKYMLMKRMFELWKEHLESNKVQRRLQRLTMDESSSNRFISFNWASSFLVRNDNNINLKPYNWNNVNPTKQLGVQKQKISNYKDALINNNQNNIECSEWYILAIKIADEYRIRSIITRTLQRWSRLHRQYLIFNVIIKNPNMALPFLKRINDNDSAESAIKAMIVISNPTIKTSRENLFNYSTEKPNKIKKKILNKLISKYKENKQVINSNLI
ncbi:hypothetical protein K502DRAFT_201504 [Neoconidiobolus thromboides FSU 785]|nr:hypothetical protein K502DRAFT_201504 [Neoconidiobolus thromboides FSU 785]